MFNFTGNGPFPFLRNVDTETIKQAHDIVRVFVGDTFVGEKVLLTEQESAKEVLHFLQQEGISSASGILEGNELHIRVEDEAEQAQVKQLLDMYLHQR